MVKGTALSIISGGLFFLGLVECGSEHEWPLAKRSTSARKQPNYIKINTLANLDL